MDEVIASDDPETEMDVERDLLWAGLPLSVTVAVKLKVPEAVGVPEMTPLLARLRPPGRLPLVMVQL